MLSCPAMSTQSLRLTGTPERVFLCEYVNSASSNIMSDKQFVAACACIQRRPYALIMRVGEMFLVLHSETNLSKERAKILRSSSVVGMEYRGGR